MSVEYTSPRAPLVEIYTKEHCPYCTQAIELLQSKNVPFIVIDLQIHPDRIPEMLQRASNLRTVPQIFINDKHIGGCDDLYKMNAQGLLDPFFTPI